MAKLTTLLLVATWMAAPAPARAQSADSISIRFRHPYGVCAGVCPNFELQVDHEGNVTTRSLWPEGTTTHFRAKFANYVHFEYLMSRLKFMDQPRLDKTCTRATLQDGSPDPLDNPRPDDLEMTWTDAHGTVRVTGCAENVPLRVALQGAVNVLGADWQFGKKLQK